jgi:hypothetical protein
MLTFNSFVERSWVQACVCSWLISSSSKSLASKKTIDMSEINKKIYSILSHDHLGEGGRRLHSISFFVSIIFGLLAKATSHSQVTNR